MLRRVIYSGAMFSPQDAAPVVSVRARRELLRLRPGELAAHTGITRQALHAAETGASVPSTLVALRLARALECRVKDLFQTAGTGDAPE